MARLAPEMCLQRVLWVKTGGERNGRQRESKETQEPPMKTPFPTEPEGELLKWLRKDGLLSELRKRGASMEEVVCALCEDRWQLREALAAAEGITPKAFRLADGTIRMWSCPVELVPVQEL